MTTGDRVKGKVAVITGAARGIGLTTSKLLAAQGASVAVTDLREEEGRSLAAEICKQGGKAAYWYLDVTDEEQVAATMLAIKEQFGPICVLVNNAGIAGASQPTHEISSGEWDRVIAVNMKGVFFCSKHVLPQMIAEKRGSIIHISSIYGIVGAADLPAYHATKGAVRLMSKTDAMFYASKGIRVNSVHPGFIMTPLVEDHLMTLGDLAEGKEALVALHPLGHLGEPIDIAYGILYLASEESKVCTGSELVIDGGYTAR